MKIFYLFVIHQHNFDYNLKFSIHCHYLRIQKEFHLKNSTVVLKMKGQLV